MISLAIIPEPVMQRRHLLKLRKKLAVCSVLGQPLHHLPERGSASVDLRREDGVDGNAVF